MLGLAGCLCLATASARTIDWRLFAVLPLSRPSLRVSRGGYGGSPQPDVGECAGLQLTETFAQLAKWLRQTGQPVRFRLSFGGSGTQARVVIDGLPADIMALALPLDVLKIQEAGLIEPDWRTRRSQTMRSMQNPSCAS